MPISIAYFHRLRCPASCDEFGRRGDALASAGIHACVFVQLGSAQYSISPSKYAGQTLVLGSPPLAARGVGYALRAHARWHGDHTPPGFCLAGGFADDEVGPDAEFGAFHVSAYGL